MPRRRRSDGTKMREAASLTSSLPILIRPPVFCSRPATIRNVVVLPHPDGPSNVTNSPSFTRRSTPLTATKSPKFRLTFSRTTFDIVNLSLQRANTFLDDAELHPSKHHDQHHHDKP